MGLDRFTQGCVTFHDSLQMVIAEKTRVCNATDLQVKLVRNQLFSNYLRVHGVVCFVGVLMEFTRFDV